MQVASSVRWLSQDLPIRIQRPFHHLKRVLRHRADLLAQPIPMQVGRRLPKASQRLATTNSAWASLGTGAPRRSRRSPCYETHSASADTRPYDLRITKHASDTASQSSPRLALILELFPPESRNRILLRVTPLGRDLPLRRDPPILLHPVQCRIQRPFLHLNRVLRHRSDLRAQPIPMQRPTRFERPRHQQRMPSLIRSGRQHHHPTPHQLPKMPRTPNARVIS